MKAPVLLAGSLSLFFALAGCNREPFFNEMCDIHFDKGLYAGIPEISVSPAPVPPRAHPGR